MLYCAENTYTQTLNSRGTSSTIRMTNHDGYLSFTDGQKLHLVSESDKEKAMKHMHTMAETLKLDLYDHDQLVYEASVTQPS